MDRPDFMGLYESYLGVYEEPQNQDYEAIVQFLASEGLVESYEEADALIEQMSDEEIAGVLDEANRYDEYVTKSIQNPAEKRTNKQTRRKWDFTNHYQVGGSSHRLTPENRGEITRYLLAKHGLDPSRDQNLTFMRQRLTRERRGKKTKGIQDSYDLVLSYLLDEGLCESVENAEVMMAHMSEGWVDAIVESYELDEASRIMMITSPSGEIRSKRKHNGYTKSDGTFVMGRPLQDESPEEKEQRRKNEHKRNREWQRRQATLNAHDESPARLRRYARMEDERGTFERQIHPKTRLASREEHLANVRAKARARKGRG